MFMFLESLHTYSLVAFVVKKNGILNRLQNTLIGWGFSLAIGELLQQPNLKYIFELCFPRFIALIFLTFSKAYLLGSDNVYYLL